MSRSGRAFNWQIVCIREAWRSRGEGRGAAAFVDGDVVFAAKEDEVDQGGDAAINPILEVVYVAR